MASKSSSKATHDLESTQEGAKSNSPSQSIPPVRPPRMKSLPNRFHHGIDRSIPGIGSRIPEASTENPKKKVVSFEQPTLPRKKRTASESSKGKEKKMSESPKKKSKPARTKRASNFESSQGQSTSSPQSSSHTQSEGEENATPVVPDAIDEILRHINAPEGFSTTNTVLSTAQNTKLNEDYMKRAFCSVVAVDLEDVRNQCNLDLSPWLLPYKSFISIASPYAPNLVRLFYLNMETANVLDDDNNLVEEKITTRVRDVKFTLSASIINSILKITNPPEISTPHYTNREIFSTLKPDEVFPEDQSLTLSFKPQSMSPLNRVLWYIYSRNFVQKGGSFSHFSTKDYRFFTAFVKKHPLNLGHWLFQQMIKFKFTSRKSSYFPFPSLISVILFYHKIWYVGPPEMMKYPPMFGKGQLNLMKLNFEEGSGHSRAPTQSQARASHSRAQEAQSTPPPPQPSLPSDLGLQIKAAVDAAVASLSIRMEYEVGKLVHEVKEGNRAIIEFQDHMHEKVNSLVAQNKDLQKKVQELTNQNSELSDQLIDLDARMSTHSVTSTMILNSVDKLVKHLPSGSSSTFGTTHAPLKSESPSPSFAFTTPTSPTTSSPIPSSTPATEVLHSSPTTPATEVLNPTSTPSTVIILPPPPTPILDPLPESSFSAPPPFEDDKGGEKDQE